MGLEAEINPGFVTVFIPKTELRDCPGLDMWEKLVGNAEIQAGSESLLHPNFGNYLLDTEGGNLGVLVILESLAQEWRFLTPVYTRSGGVSLDCWAP